MPTKYDIPEHRLSRHDVNHQRITIKAASGDDGIYWPLPGGRVATTRREAMRIARDLNREINSRRSA